MTTFEQAWELYKVKGYDYGPDALEQVKFGWEIAQVHITTKAPQIKDLDAINRLVGERNQLRLALTLLNQKRDAIVVFHVNVHHSPAEEGLHKSQAATVLIPYNDETHADNKAMAKDSLRQIFADRLFWVESWIRDYGIAT